jgi:hypothetical protein
VHLVGVEGGQDGEGGEFLAVGECADGLEVNNRGEHSGGFGGDDAEEIGVLVVVL